jgi:hypothetical protein
MSETKKTEFYIVYNFACAVGHHGSGTTFVSLPSNLRWDRSVIKDVTSAILRDVMSDTCNGLPPNQLTIVNIINLDRL